MAKVISFINEKGGVGKTTSTNVVAAILKNKEYKVLCIDFDPQGHLSSGFGADVMSSPTIYDVLKHRVKERAAIQNSNVVDIIPANDMLKSIEAEFTGKNNHELLKEVIKPLMPIYDYILIDSPPELGLMSVNALVASDVVLIPSLPDGYSLMGTIKVHETISRVKDAFNKSLSIAGIVLIRYYARERLSKTAAEVLGDISKKMDIPILNTKIRHSNIVCDATTVRQADVMKSIPKNKAIGDYVELVDELLKKGLI